MFMTRTAEPLTINTKAQSEKPGHFAAAYQYTEEKPARHNGAQDPDNGPQDSADDGLSPRRRVSPRTLIGLNGYNATPDPPPAMYVRALYNYETDDHTSLSFRQGDIIQVLTQLESGWWDGVINDVRGWFPSNYCVVISGPDDPGDLGLHRPGVDDASAESGTEDDYDEEQEDDDVDSEGNPREDITALPIEGTENNKDQEEAAFWIPQATPDGRLFYFNTLTGVSTMELPLETPTSANETGPRDRTNINVPEQTRPPPEMILRGYERDEEDYDGSASEAEGESLMLASQGSLPRRRRSFISDGVSPATSMDSMNASPVSKSRGEARDPYQSSAMGAVQHATNVMAPSVTSNTFFTTNPVTQLSGLAIPRYFFDDGTTVPTTWTRLVENMRRSVEAYREVVNNRESSELVRKAEDISDHLRMLLAAGSGTTDNHSGNPSVISTNKALYPHFRDMMSRFSKLVLSSHIAAADWPGPESYAKCLQEADGVLNGVYGYVDIARHQRGENIPRLVPGFVLGSLTGGNWQNNNMSSRDPMNSTSFMDQDEYEPYVEPTALLDINLIRRMDDVKKMLVASIRRLEEQLVLTEKVISPSRQAFIGDNICHCAGKVIDLFRPWISMVESINLAPLGSTFQNQNLQEFSTQKQRIYDNIAALVTSSQAVAAPLGDEWAEIRGDSLEDRLNHVRNVSRSLETSISRTGFLLQLLLETMPAEDTQQRIKGEHRMTDGGETYQLNHLRGERPQAPAGRPTIGDIGQSQSYTLGEGAGPEKFKRPNNNADKARRFFGQMPPTDLSASKDNSKDRNFRDPMPPLPDETPWFLKLDHESEVQYDPKSAQLQLKSGSLTGLVEQLTRHDKLDASFNSTFLLTYRSFTSASELFEMLVRRFSVQPPYGLAKEDYSTWEDRKQKPIRFRVVNILKNWLENFWMEAVDDGSMRLLPRIYAFAKDSITTTKTPGSGPLMAIVEQRLKKQDTTAKRLVLTLNTSAPPPILPKNMKKLKFLDIDATEFARQLTIIESRLYGKIKPTECLNKTWQKTLAPGEPEPAVNVKALILHSNQLTNWVAEMILTQSDVKKRVVVIKHFVTVADKCRSMNNFSTVTSIVSALGASPINRLHRTWAQVNQRTRSALAQMNHLMQSTRNFAAYRESIHQANPPCIPFLGM